MAYFNGKKMMSAEVNFAPQIPVDWNQKDETALDYIKNKPIIETPEDNTCGLQMVDPWEPNDNDGTFSTALGSGNLIDEGANYCTALGFENAISNAGKQNALGLRNVLSGNISQAMGRYNTVKGVTTIGIGERNNVNHNNAIAVGCGLAPASNKQVVVGQFNAPNEDALFIVGSGSEERQNAMTISKDGEMTLGGYFVDDAIITNLRGVDTFNDLDTDANIGINSEVVITDMRIIDNKYKTAKFIATGESVPWLQAQANIPYLYVTADYTYKLSFYVYSAYSNPEQSISFWLAAMPKGEEDTVFTSESFVEHKVYTTEPKAYKNDALTKVDIEFTPNKSGLIRFGIYESSAGAKYSLGNFVLSNITRDLPVYNYKSKNGDHTETLYKVADVPCSVDNIEKWLVGKTIYTEYGPVTLTKDDITNSIEEWCDEVKNYIVMYKNGNVPMVLMCIVDSIAPKEMEVSELGLYVCERVITIPYRRWVDTPWTDIIDNY